MKLTTKLKTEILSIYNTYWDNYLKGDVEAMNVLLADEYTQVGSADTEVFYSKKDAVKFLYETIDQVAGKLEMRNRSTRLEQQENLILIHELCDIYVLAENKWTFYAKARASTLMQKKKEGWKIIHQHSSFPDARTGNGENIAIDKIAEENRELREAVKRRTIELEQINRELEIETSLEKVRASAMSMHKSHDLLDVCEILYKELNKLGFDEMRNAMINIHNDEKETFINYDYSDEIGRSVNHLTYNIHPVIEKQIKQIRNTNDAFSVTSFAGKDLEEWKKFRRKIGEKDDQRINNISALYYYFYSIGAGSIGISTFNSINEEKLTLLKRFRNVFSLAYQRYSDIALAEAQAREARIETALERVRAVAMAMHKPEDLSSIGKTIFSELTSLGFSSIRNTEMVINNDEKETVTSYHYSDYGKEEIIEIKYETNSIVKQWAQDLRKAEDAFVPVSIPESQMKSWNNYRIELGYKSDPKMAEAKSVQYYSYSIGLGALSISTWEKLSDEQIKILERFRNVFKLSYQRYKDIEQAEAQAREAEIQLALERVRARSLAMHHTSELQDVVKILAQQLHNMNLDINGGVFIVINDEVDKDIPLWASGGMTDYVQKVTVPFLNSPIFIELRNAIKRKNNFFEEERSDKEKIQLFKHLFNYPPWNNLPQQRKEELISRKGGYTRSVAISNLTSISITNHNGKKFSDDDNEILKRFGSIFEQSYIRFLDLQKAEAQARESQIELALERVRARTMAMQKSEELKEVIRVVYDQFVHLKINVDHAGFVVDYIPKGDWHFWIADEQDIPSKITHPYFESVWASQFNEAKEKGADFFTTNLNFEEKNKFYNELLSYVPGLPKESKDFYLSCPGLAASTALFDHVSLYIENFSGIPYTDEENNTLMRFGKVFQQTYTRFLDLQKAEAQAREAQTEASLEKVRSVAMSMNKSRDLLNICEVSFKEFKKLGFDNIRNALIHIQYDEKKYFMDYDFSDLTGGAITKIEYGSHPVVEDYLEQIRSAKDAFYQGVIKEEQLEEWKDFRRSSGQIDDPRLDKATALYYYFFSIGIGDIGLSTFKPIDESQIKILKRFRNVFDLAYRRFNDITLAEQQARETQIQLALERVRARTMAMHKSDELADTVFVLFQQFKELGIEPKMLTIGIINEQERVIEFWVTDWSGSGSKVNRKFKASIEEPILLSKIYACWKEQKKSIEIELSNKELQAWIDYRVKLSEIPDEKDYSTSKGYVVAANFSKGILSISSYEPQTPETVQLLERFAGVFDLTYTRFFDLQKAEAQAREAKIETALERVRAKAMAMHTSNDLSDTMGVLFTELPKLGINSLRCGVVLLSRDSLRGVFYAAASTPESDSFTMIGAGDMDDHPVFMKQHEHWLKNENYFTSLSNEELESYYKALFARLSIPYTPREHKVKTEHGYYFAFTEGMFYAWAEEPYSEEEINILNRFKAIIDLTFRRYLDLQKAEAQAKEAKIEVSLERVRSKAMAMHSPNDLAETVNVFFKELKTLGIIPIRCGVGQIDEATRTTSLTTTTSSQQGESFQVIGKVKQTGHPVLDGIFDHWKLQKEYFPVLEGEDIKAYYDVMNPQIGYPEYPAGVTQYGNSFPFKEGFVFAWTENKLSEEELQIFRRFTSVLSLTYRRYMDLKEAEAQAREAKIEASLEKVRSKTMAMQSSDELADTAAVVFQQLINLGIEPNRIYITIIKDEFGFCEFWITDEDGTKVSSAFKANLNENQSFKKMYDGWNQNKKSITIDMYGEELQEYYRHLSKLNVPFKDGLSQKRRMQYIAYFSKGFIGVASPDETKPETIQLLERFAAVFNLTYTRFNDLQQAEAQNKIIQAENERKTKELEEARQLQLAMLPKSIPEIPNLDIAVYMKTATEVGGDYYDFKVQENGVLNIGIGDATGHGLQAGTMITLMKGFFTSDVARFSPQKFLEHCNGMIRDIKLGRILMSFSHLRFNSNSLLISSAGMPPIYYHHKKNNRTEEIIIQGLPLGAMESASYKLVEKQLNSGDTILLLTDGLPEQMNSHKVIFDYSRVLKYFDEISENTPNAIINSLVQKANEWMNGTAQVDDITFVVIRVK